jgi:C-terminal processing protease CtpA/Prc
MLPSGQPLDGRGVVPDMTVAPPPGDAAKPQDPQLMAAVNYLRRGKR